MTDRGELLWSPAPDAMGTTAMGRFATLHGHRSYDELLAWSLADLDGFWRAVTEFTGVIWRTPPAGGPERPGGEAGSATPRVALAEPSMPGARWFPGAALNYAEHAVRAGEDRPGEPAVVARSQTRDPSELTWSELSAQVARCAAGLRRLGVGPGDRVAAYLPNIPEALVGLLATASIGAVWSSCSPESGVRAVLDRFGQISPKVLLAVDGYRYGAKTIDRRGDVAAIADALGTVEHVIGVRYLGTGADGWSAMLDEPGAGAPAFAAVGFDHPLYILFSSGTTGLPKPIVHGHGGITVEHLKTLALHHDLGPGDRFLWYTTTGWMMWNYLVSGLATGATVVLFDGDPAHPGLTTLWDVAAETATTGFGASAPFLMRCRRDQLTPARGALRWVGSTGAPLPAEGFRWVHETLGVPVASVSGGTDVCTAFVGMSPLLAVRAGEISGRLLGCAVEAYDPTGRPVPPGTTGELVITAPMPSMPVGFWNDPGGERYRRAYFDTYPGVWRHGDWITFTGDGACVISGRSDATLNRGGVRLGTADFYTVVESLPEVADSLVVHIEATGGEGQLLLFVVPTPGATFDDATRGRITAALRAELSPRHLPDRIEVVPAVPRTLTGKKLEVPVKKILRGAPAAQVASAGSLADPDSLAWFEHYRASQDLGSDPAA